VLADARTVGLGSGAAGGATAVAAAAAAADAALVLMGAACSRDDVMAGLDLGADDFLETKPSLSQLKLQNLWQHTVRREMRRLGIGAPAWAPAAAERAPALLPPPPPAVSAPPSPAAPEEPCSWRGLRRCSSEGAAAPVAAYVAAVPIAAAPGSPCAWLGGCHDDSLLCAWDDADLAALGALDADGLDTAAMELDGGLEGGVGSSLRIERAPGCQQPRLRPHGSLPCASPCARPLSRAADVSLLSSPLRHAISCSDASCATALGPPLARAPPLHRSASAPNPAFEPLVGPPPPPLATHLSVAAPFPAPQCMPAPWMCPWPAYMLTGPPAGCSPGMVWGLPIPNVVTAPGLPLPAGHGAAPARAPAAGC
jgi:hypothetical protein